MAKKFKDLAGACWKGYKAVGLKDKNGRKVPNCVPEEVQMEAKKDEEETVDRVERSDYKVSPTGRKSHKQIVFKMGEEELKEGTVSKKDYSWGKMMTVHHGKDISYPLHPEHQKIVKNLRPSGEHSKAMYKDETGNQVHVTREDDKVHFVSHRTSGSKKTTVDYKHFDESVPAKNTDIADKSYLKDMGKKPTVKSDLKNFKNFLTGKKETNEAYSMDDVRKDAEEHLKKSIDKQSDDRIAALKNPPKKKGFFARVGEKQINMVKGAYKGLTKEEVEEISEAAPFKTKEDAVKYAKEKVKTHRDNLDGIEVYAHSGGFDVNHTSNSSGRNSLNKIGAKHLGTIYKEEVEQVEEGWYEKPASAYRRKGDEIGGGSSTNFSPNSRATLSRKDEPPFDGPYTKTKATKNSDGTTQSPMSRARALAKDAMKQKMKEEFGLDITDEQAESLVEASYNNPHKFAAAEIKAGTFKSYSPTAPVPDKKYIKGTPENKAYKATKKPINGMPTNVKEEAEQIDELDQKTLKSYVNKNLKTGDTSGKRDDGLYRATNKIAKKQATSTLDKKVKTLGNTRPADQKNRYEYEASRSELKNRGIHWFAGRRTTKEEVELDEVLKPSMGAGEYVKDFQKSDAPQFEGKSKKKRQEMAIAAYLQAKREMKEETLDEANHREFASQGKMHPDMAKHMSVGNEMDFYAHGTGDKMSGKVLKNDGKEVHIKTTINPYKEKDSSVHKFKVASKLDEELKGNQHKLDKNKNGKLDKQDFKLIRKEDFENGEVETNVKSYKEFLQSLDEIKMSDLPARKVSGKYGTEYYKGEAEKDVKGYDDEDTPAKPAGEKRGRGRPAGSTSGARQKGTIAKRKGSGVEMTGYPVHLPNFK